MRKTPKTQQGMGLMEVLVAAVIMAVGLMAVAAFHSNLNRDSEISKAR